MRNPLKNVKKCIEKEISDSDLAICGGEKVVLELKKIIEEFEKSMEEFEELIKIYNQNK